MRDTILTCDSEPPCRRGNGFTGIDRGTHACAFARVRRNRVTSQYQGLAPRSARNNCPARDNIRSGLKVCCDVRTLFEVGRRRTVSLPATKNNCVAFPSPAVRVARGLGACLPSPFFFLKASDFEASRPGDRSSLTVCY